MGLITIQDIQYVNAGSEAKREVVMTFSSSYNNTGNEATTGDSLRAVDVGLFNITRVDMPDADGYVFQPLYDTGSALTLPSTARIQAFQGAGGVTGATSAGTPAGTISTPTFAFTAKNFTTQSYFDVKGATKLPNQNADGTEIVNATFIAPYTTVTAGTWTVGALTNPDIPRGISISIKNDSGGPLNLFEGTTIFTVTGTDMSGITRTQNIPLISTALDKTIATGFFRSAQMTPSGDTICFRTITNVTITNPPDNGLKIGVGISTTIEMVGALPTMGLTDVLNVSLNGIGETVLGNLVAPGAPTTQHSFRYSDMVNGDDVSIVFPQRSGYTGTVSTPTFSGTALGTHTHSLNSGSNSEVPNGTNLGSIIGPIRATIFGY